MFPDTATRATTTRFQRVPVSRLRRTVLAALALGVLGSSLVACEDDSGTSTPYGVLSVDQVGGTVADDLVSRIAVPGSCGLNSVELTGGADEKNTAVFSRTVDGHDEYVVVGAYERARTNTQDALHELAEDIKGEQCNTDPYSADRLELDGLPRTFAFEARGSGTDSDTNEDWTSDLKRSFTYVDSEAGGTMVLVSIERRDGSVPPTTELTDLTRRQLALTDQNLGE